jgi:nicotinamide mononucleotide transporter
MDIFSVNKVFFTFLDYPMSYIEFFGTLLNIACVFLLVKKNIINWFIGILACVAFASLFYQLRLYADLFEQIYFFITGIIGWIMWQRAKCDTPTNTVVKRSSNKYLTWLGISFVAGTVIGYYIITNLNDWLPKYFPDEASYPVIDVSTTVASFQAQIMLTQRRLENWMLWIAVDVVGIWLYWQKEVPFISALYVLFLILAIRGLKEWRDTYANQTQETSTLIHV